MPALALDHIVVAAERLEDGVSYVEDLLGVTLAPGGKHTAMGTHNRLLGLGDAYLEVIAIDPEAPPPDRPRWFDLDNFTGAPRLSNWVAKTPDLSAALAVAPPDSGQPMELSRGDLSWTIAISDAGTLPFQGAFPGLIDWADAPHPTTRLPTEGCRLRSWQVSHPDTDAVRAALSAFETDLTSCVVYGPLGFRAEIETLSGVKVLT